MSSIREQSHRMLGKCRMITPVLAIGLALALPALASQNPTQAGHPAPTHPLAKPQPADPQGGILPDKGGMTPKQASQRMQQGPVVGRPVGDTPILRDPPTCPPGTVWVPDRHPIDPIPGQPIIIHGECVPKYKPVQQQQAAGKTL